MSTHTCLISPALGFFSRAIRGRLLGGGGDADLTNEVYLSFPISTSILDVAASMICWRRFLPASPSCLSVRLGFTWFVRAGGSPL